MLGSHIFELGLEFIMALLQKRVIIVDFPAEGVGELEVAAWFLKSGEEVHNNFIQKNKDKNKDKDKNQWVLFLYFSSP